MSALFQRVFQHLFPTGQAWRLTTPSTLRKFVDGLSSWPADFRDYADAVFSDVFPSSTRELAEWEKQFGLEPNADEATRRLSLAAEWAATGGQSPGYIQGVLQTAGFNVFIHDAWASGPPYVWLDPHGYTAVPLIGTYQCGAFGAIDQPPCIGFDSEGIPLDGQPECDAFLANDPGYLVNLDLTPRPPPAIPTDPNVYPFFLYVGGASFPARATVSTARRDEFKRLLLKLRPLHLWIVVLVDYTGIFDASFDNSFN